MSYYTSCLLFSVPIAKGMTTRRVDNILIFLKKKSLAYQNFIREFRRPNEHGMHKNKSWADKMEYKDKYSLNSFNF